jgi:hypothetical protein
MRTIIVFFIALIAIPVVEVAFAPALERGGTPILTDRSSKILIALGESPDPGYPMTQGRSGDRRRVDASIRAQPAPWSRQ